MGGQTLANAPVLLALLLGFFCFPLLKRCGSPGTIDTIESWAVRGPLANEPAIPEGVMGAYVLKGLNPALLLDLSYARSWSPSSRSLVLDLGGPGVVYMPKATATDFRDDLATTTPVPGLPGHALGLLSRVLRSSVKVTFNEDYTSADIAPRLISDLDPLAFVFTRLLKQTATKDNSGVWKRTTFAPPSNATASPATYSLVPVVTKRPKGYKVHANGLKLAKRKLSAAGNALEQCGA